MHGMTDPTKLTGEETVLGTRPTVDVVVAGGGLAGLAGALTLARARRSVLVVDSPAAQRPGRERPRLSVPGRRAAAGTAGFRAR